LSPFSISSHDDPPAADWAVVDEGLGDFNDQAAPLHEVKKLASFARDEAGRVIGGALGRRWGRCAEIQELWVEESARGQGLGAQLVDAFEAAARAHGCTDFYLETLSFQAPGFYAKLGYRTVHVLDVYPHGIVKHLMLKTS
jgi:GNAT superfamily N-acetyltransferase